MQELTVVGQRRPTVSEKRGIGRDEEGTRYVNSFATHAGVVVIEASAARACDLTGPEIQPTFVRFRLIDQEISVMLADEEPLIVNRVGRRGKRTGPEQAIRCPCGNVAQLTESRIALDELTYSKRRDNACCFSWWSLLIYG